MTTLVDKNDHNETEWAILYLKLTCYQSLSVLLKQQELFFQGNMVKNCM